jgi:ABC-type uncharacterized transport system substrate-binding protein
VRRRTLLLAVLAAAYCGRTATAETARVVGVLAPGPLRPITSFKRRLGELGWSEGRNVRFEERWGESDDTRYPAFAVELAAIPANVILTWGTPALLAAKQATTAIPIVMGTIGDPLSVGAVASLARPEGNVTGFTSQNYELEDKRLELLRELVPGLRRLAMIGNAGNPYSGLAVNRVRELATAAGLALDEVNLDEAGGVDAALERIRQARPDGVIVAAVPALFPYRRQIVEFMAANRIPAVYPFREFAEAGGLLVYATDFDDLFRRAAGYVDKVLRGTLPEALPVQQAATFELVINMNTAKALQLLIRAANM